MAYSPFVIGALQRKIKAMFFMLERHRPPKNIYDDGRLFLDFSEQSAALDGKPINLSTMEYRMLNLFRKNPRQVLTRSQLLEKLWDIDEKFMDEHTLTAAISQNHTLYERMRLCLYFRDYFNTGLSDCVLWDHTYTLSNTFDMSKNGLCQRVLIAEIFLFD